MKYLSILFLITVQFCFGQQNVESKLYNTMLKSLLSHSVAEIDVKTAKENLGKAIFLDARPKNEFEVGHIQDAIRVGYEDFSIKSVKKIDKEQPIIVYCSVGYRSEKVAEKLKAKGFKNVHNLYGGLFEWANQDAPVYVQNKQTDSIHAYNKIWGSWIKNKSKVKVYR